MLTRLDFSAPQWYTMQTALIGAAHLVVLSDKALVDDIREKRVFKKLLKQAEKEDATPFIRELADFEHYKSPITKHIWRVSTALEVPVLAAIRDSVELLAKKDTDDLTAFRITIHSVTSELAHRIDGTTEPEKAMLKKIKDALYS